MSNRRQGGSSPTKEKNYKYHYEILNNKRKVNILKILKKLEANNPNTKYKINEIETSKKGNRILKYTISKVK